MPDPNFQNGTTQDFEWGAGGGVNLTLADDIDQNDQQPDPAEDDSDQPVGNDDDTGEWPNPMCD